MNTQILLKDFNIYNKMNKTTEAKQGRTAKGIKIIDSEKANKVKQLYSGYWIEELINALQEAGEEGVSLNDLIDILSQPREKVRIEILSLKNLGITSGE